MEFVAQTRFERMGAFAYCEEDDTYAAKHLPDNIPGDVKAQRLDRLMALQESISLDIQENKIGQTLKVIRSRLLCRTHTMGFAGSGSGSSCGKRQKAEQR